MVHIHRTIGNVARVGDVVLITIRAGAGIDVAQVGHGVVITICRTTKLAFIGDVVVVAVVARAGIEIAFIQHAVAVAIVGDERRAGRSPDGID